MRISSSTAGLLRFKMVGTDWFALRLILMHLTQIIECGEGRE